jgi:hypothetical protein
MKQEYTVIKKVDVKDILMEAVDRCEHLQVNPIKNFRLVLETDEYFDAYIEGLASGLESKDKEEFMSFAHITRNHLWESSTFMMNPYEQISFPLLRFFWPKLGIREAITVCPMDKPAMVKYMLMAKARRYGSSTDEELPVYGTSSQGPSASIALDNDCVVPSTTDLLTPQSLTPSLAGIQRGSVRITQLTFLDDTSSMQTADVTIQPDIDGNFSYTQVTGTGVTDTIHGSLDFENGIIRLSHTSTDVVGIITQCHVIATASLEYNSISTAVTLSTQKILLEAVGRKLMAEYTIEFEQDARALFSLDAQSDIVSILSNQIVLDIENEIVQDILATVYVSQPNNIDSFSKTVPATFALGKLEWYKNIVVKLSELSARVYYNTNIGAANVILANPLDIPVLSATNMFNFVGNVLDGGVLQEKQEPATSPYKWQVLCSPVVPSGRMPVILKPEEERAATYLYCPYIPVTVVPGFPTRDVPSLTVMSRYDKRCIRSEGLAVLEITT